jgi:uncharacterized membrane protein YccC
MFALGAILEFVTTNGFTADYTPVFSNFTAHAIAQLTGTAVSVAVIHLVQAVGNRNSILRIVRTSWRDVARRAEGHPTDEIPWTSMMLDRAAVILPRLVAESSAKSAFIPQDALLAIRIGILTGRLRRLRHASELKSLRDLLDALAKFFEKLNPARPVRVPGQLLARVDECIHTIASDPNPRDRLDGLVLLTGLRRNLFPAATSYRPQP